MTTGNFRLISLPGNDGKNGNLPYGSRAYIGIKNITEVPCPSTQKGTVETRIAISYQCVNAGELGHEIDRLIEELLALKKRTTEPFQKEGASE